MGSNVSNLEFKHISIIDQSKDDFDVSDNLIRLNNVSNCRFLDCRFEKCTFFEEDLVNVIFEDCYFEDVIFNFLICKNITLINCKFKWCLFERVDFINGKIKDCTIDKDSDIVARDDNFGLNITDSIIENVDLNILNTKGLNVTKLDITDDNIFY